MRKYLLAMLLAATAATPAFADPGDNRGPRVERSQRAPDRGREIRQDRREVRDSRRDVRQAQGNLRQERRDVGRAIRRDASPGYVASQRRDVREARRDVRVERRDLRGDRRDLRQDRRYVDNNRRWDNDRRDDRRWDNNRRDDRRWDNDRRGYDNRRYAGYGHNNGWNRGWRDDRRYDWWSHRARYGDRYRMPRYYGPRGYSYRTWYRGYRADPYFYGRNYWISDPYDYRLPPAYGSYRWVRYYNDVALVDVTNGIVADLIVNFFL